MVGNKLTIRLQNSVIHIGANIIFTFVQITQKNNLLAIKI